jgi:hypothetical protein
MSQQKITDELWVEARRRYETEPDLGSGKVAQLLDVLKSLVARKVREGKWQKDIGVPNLVHPTARERRLSTYLSRHFMRTALVLPDACAPD